jgi:hypothetical protein
MHATPAAQSEDDEQDCQQAPALATVRVGSGWQIPPLAQSLFTVHAVEQRPGRPSSLGVNG